MPAPDTRPLFRFGDHVVAATLHLATLVRAAPGDGPPDITVSVHPLAAGDPGPVEAWRHHWVDQAGQNSLSLAVEGSVHRLRFRGQCDFLIDAAAGAIRAEPVHGLSQETLEHLLVDQVLPRLLAHRGELVTHASVVDMGNAACAFIGHSGWGKSTLASLLRSAGHRLLSDDCALLRTDGATVHALATYPSLRMYEDSIGQTICDAVQVSPVATYTNKLRVTVEHPTAGQLASPPIRAIYLLNDPSRGEARHSITAMTPMDACMALVEHSFRLDVTTPQHTRLLLAQAAAVQRLAPVFHLRYPRDYLHSARLLEVLHRHFGGLASARAAGADA